MGSQARRLGAATVLPGFTVAAQPAQAAPTASGSGYHIYAHGMLSDGVVGFNASDIGQPTPIAGRAPTGVPDWPQAATPDGRFLYVAPMRNPRLIAYSIGSGGALTATGAPLALPDIPVDITFAPNSRYGYVLVGGVNGAVVPVRLGTDGAPVANGPTMSLGAFTDGLRPCRRSTERRTGR
ncbi:hypothetical protein [Nocardia jiangxiensis]|uniref:Lactonase, 7-bladed beta-propeller n=1 Tax=Nocardia jiangxiensis TaxID=282685 RepID=A0ABW6SGY6_9NOCA|nr:hypothetical protein [Nocardia jiangxiensis]